MAFILLEVCLAKALDSLLVQKPSILSIYMENLHTAQKKGQGKTYGLQISSPL